MQEQSQTTNPVLEFHAKKCCWFDYNESRQGLQFLLEKIKDYKDVEATWRANHGKHSLWKCPKCGAYFLLLEDEWTAWRADGDDWDMTLRYWYQVDSPEHADKLMSVEYLFGEYDGPSMRG